MALIAPDDQRRAIRFAVALTASTSFVEATAMPLGVLCSVLTAVMLSTRAPRPDLRAMGALIVAVVASFSLGTLLALTILQGPLIYYTAMFLLIYRVLLGTARGLPPTALLMILLAVVMTPIVGLTSSHLAIDFAADFVRASLGSVGIVLAAHTLLPDLPEAGEVEKAPGFVGGELLESHRYALRRTIALLPLLLWVVSFGQTSDMTLLMYAAILIQAPGVVSSRMAGRAMIAGSLVGGVGAVFIYLVGSAFVSFFVYLMLVAFVALLLGQGMFSTSRVAESCAKAPAAFLILTDKSDAFLGDSTADALVTRLSLILLATLYVAVAGLLLESLARRDRFSPPGRARRASSQGTGAAR